MIIVKLDAIVFQLLLHRALSCCYYIGSIHSGMGCTDLKKLFACMDIPSITTDTYKQYEQVVDLIVEKAAKDSCKQAAIEERRLVLENIEKIREQL